MMVYAFDNQKDLKMLEDTLRNLMGNDLQFRGFTNIGSLLSATMTRKCDVVFTDMESNNGMMLLGTLFRLYHRISIIGVANKENAQTSLLLNQLHASGYLIKPYDAERLADSLRHLLYSSKTAESIIS